MTTNLEELARLHDLAENGDADERMNAADGIHLALPGLIAELRALREVAEAAHQHEEMDQPGMPTLRDNARDMLRAALAKVPR
jgi:hypothetical protein